MAVSAVRLICDSLPTHADFVFFALALVRDTASGATRFEQGRETTLWALVCVVRMRARDL